MSMNFSEQIKKRIENDKSVLKMSFSDLLSIVSSDIKIEEGITDTKKTGEEAIKKILNYYGAKINATPDDIDDENEMLEYMLKPTGIMRRRIEFEGKWWTQTTGPILGCTADGNLIALMPRLLSGYSYFDPFSGKNIKINSKTAKSILREGFCFYRPLPAKKLNLLDLVIFAQKSISKADIIYVLGASLLVTLLGLLFPIINKQVFDSIIPSGTKGDVLPVTILLLGSAVASALFIITKNIVLVRFGDKIKLSVESAIMNRILSLKTSFFKNYPAGELTNRLSAIEQLCIMLSDTIVTPVLSVIFSLAYVIQMHSYAPALVLPAMAAIFLMLGFTVIIGFMQNCLTKKKMMISAKVSGLVYQLFSGIQKIKLAGAEKRAFGKWASIYKEQGKLTYSPPMLLKMQNALITAVSMFGTLLIYYSAYRTGVSASDYIAFNAAYAGVNTAVLGLASVVMALASIKPLMEMIKPVLEAVPEINENKTILKSISGKIEVNNVTFRYTKDGPAILNNLSFRVEPGEYIAVVGKTGCGKSTLIRLLLGFEKPEEGAVYYDGMNLENLDVRSVRKTIGVVMQNGKIFTGDIYSNIVISAPWLTIDDAWEAARLAGLEKDIQSMPMGMYTMIGEGCGGISGGQKQRLMIARAVAPKPKIIIFDEATSALDNITQKMVSDSVGSLKSTRIVIAHRLSTIKDCDRIVVIDKGEISEQGTFDELIQRGGLFCELAQRQMA